MASRQGTGDSDYEPAQTGRIAAPTELIITILRSIRACDSAKHSTGHQTRAAGGLVGVDRLGEHRGDGLLLVAGRQADRKAFAN